MLTFYVNITCWSDTVFLCTPCKWDRTLDYVSVRMSTECVTRDVKTCSWGNAKIL